MRAAWSSRQKSFRGLAKCACAAAETRPGLIPTKTTRRFGPRTSGTALCSFGRGSFGIVRPRVDAGLELAAQILSGDRELVSRPARLNLDDLHRRIRAAVTAGVALGLGERAQADDEPQ